MKCEDTACNARLQKLPLVFQRGHPICPVCNRGILHQEVSKLYRTGKLEKIDVTMIITALLWLLLAPTRKNMSVDLMKKIGGI